MELRGKIPQPSCCRNGEKKKEKRRRRRKAKIGIGPINKISVIKIGSPRVRRCNERIKERLVYSSGLGDNQHEMLSFGTGWDDGRLW